MFYDSEFLRNFYSYHSCNKTGNSQGLMLRVSSFRLIYMFTYMRKYVYAKFLIIFMFGIDVFSLIFNEKKCAYLKSSFSGSQQWDYTR